jgi:hypothetical protein
MASDNKPGTGAQDEAGDFLARWSRRKLEARAGVADDIAEVGQTEEPQAVPPVAAPPERELTDADMPPLDSLTANSDFTPFMSPGVSDGLRRLALRKLFSQPAFNITDGLNDYDEDFTQFTGLGSVITHEMKRLLEREQAAAEGQGPAADAVPDPDAQLPPDRPPGEAAAAPAAGGEVAGSADNSGDEDEEAEDRDA